ncbi:Gfo/Idh/MocA family oxidoreductase [Streptomyces sp. CA-142005]|uniref:Gfo/Idh/MocA family oxidoreductase n=1 Tax=Streptomyces sp. CA-142005 TaxID=3240052 RepID=UPI003D8C767E
MSTVRIGVIGAGNMGADHVNTLHRWVSGAEVVSVADVDGERARRPPPHPAGGGTPLAYTEPRTAHDALHFEAAEAARCITTGQLQSPLRTLADSITTLRVMDDIRALCGITFPPQ